MALFSPLMKRMREKINSTIFEGCYLNSKFKIHKLSQLSITWILKELKLYKPLFKDIPEIKLSHWYLLSKTYIKNHIQKLELSLSLTALRVIQIIALFLFGFWVNESQLSDCSCSHFLSYYKILFPFSWLSIMQILFWNLLSVDCQDF